jgi:hypothetical protein
MVLNCNPLNTVGMMAKIAAPPDVWRAFPVDAP